MAIGRAGRRGETMSVIVKGMQMPSECRKCFAMDYGTMTGETYCKVNGKTLAESYRPIGFDGRPDWCPLVELPEKHGRLIDADKLFEEMRCANWEISYFFDGTFLNISEFANIIQNIVTVIEAEDGT